MQKYRFIQFIIPALFCLITQLFAQSDRYYQLYLENDITALEDLLKDGSISHTFWKKFVKALFIEDVETAIPLYVEIYENTNDENLKKLTLDRVSQYYYAKGFYDTANRLLEDKNYREKVFSVKKRQVQFGIQLGAFSTYENALKRKTDLSEKLDDLFIVTKNKNGRQLHVVIAGKMSDRAEAEKLKHKIYSKTGIKGMILQY